GGSAAATGPAVSEPAAPATGSGTPSSGGSSSGGSTSPSGGGSPSATPEQCAALNQALAFIDHPDLRALKVQTGC
ncbi:MAG TPA: hypothetical protein VFK43_17355, partial [Acidimicrobiales bacterium]|nr:hypothetical protein [Acidimicrobiales bacterium]